MIIQAFDGLIRHLVYYLCADECDYVAQWLQVGWVLSFSLTFKKKMTNR